ncbi:MAG: septation protein IspZ [Phenylobacterium sp.]|uniref:septation protein IspZ n=1 Tax=Phenylobacterium sp. TaxID=1871053 RepID=UPI00391A20A3
MNPLLHAARPLLADFLSTLVFVVLIALKVDVVWAVAAAAGVGLGQVALLKLRGAPVAALQWLSLALVLVSGAASLFTHDPRFVMAKPSVVYLIVSAAMLQRGWMLRYMPPVAAGHAEDVMIAFGYVWAGLMALSAAANLVVAVAWPHHWAAFMAVFPLASKAGLFGVQYLTTHRIVRRRIRSAGPAQTKLSAAEA